MTAGPVSRSRRSSLKNFEERLARLEQLTQLVRSPQTPLADAVAGFEEGFKLAQTLEKDLERLEKRVEILLNPPAPGSQGPGEDPTFDLFSDLPKAP
jgi:exodeoxyribonuclease VII small subunit